MDEKKKILIVDDESSFREALKQLLGNRFELFEAANGQEARSLVTLKKFDLIISDDQMPFLTGTELLEWVKKNFPTKFILMLQSSKNIDKIISQEYNADNILIKPFSESELFEVIDSLQSQNQSAQIINSSSQKI